MVEILPESSFCSTTGHPIVLRGPFHHPDLIWACIGTRSYGEISSPTQTSGRFMSWLPYLVAPKSKYLIHGKELVSGGRVGTCQSKLWRRRDIRTQLPYLVRPSKQEGGLPSPLARQVRRNAAGDRACAYSAPSPQLTQLLPSFCCHHRLVELARG